MAPPHHLPAPANRIVVEVGGPKIWGPAEGAIDIADVVRGRDAVREGAVPFVEDARDDFAAGEVDVLQCWEDALPKC